MPTFALAIKKHTQLQIKIGSVAQLNRASDYGSEGCRFESCRSHSDYQIYKKENVISLTFSFFILLLFNTIKDQIRDQILLLCF